LYFFFWTKLKRFANWFRVIGLKKNQHIINQV
jgi:hypothetical protein